ncbi:hypothetical protein E2C01_098124 [Portunus trituberculatus]|uniref:Uncharacterized protein n=1 Tax=Portunus trituberculatus TaxID=210409 RepID=A0A5B7K7F6_PORTR|nr:hypothetical protein [Portunus trituberculatus]
MQGTQRGSVLYTAVARSKRILDKTSAASWGPLSLALPLPRSPGGASFSFTTTSTTTTILSSSSSNSSSSCSSTQIISFWRLKGDNVPLLEMYQNTTSNPSIKVRRKGEKGGGREGTNRKEGQRKENNSAAGQWGKRK